MSSNQRSITPNSGMNYGATDMIDTKEAKQIKLTGNTPVATIGEPPKPAVRLKIKKMSKSTNKDPEKPVEYLNDAFERDQASAPIPTQDTEECKSEDVKRCDDNKLNNLPAFVAGDSKITNSSEQAHHQLDKCDIAGVIRSVNQIEAEHRPITKCSALPLPIAIEPPQRSYPKKVLFIVANEFCERFSYYGLRTVLVLYLTDVLGFSNKNATVSFHLFTTLCYIMPILGAILGDSIWGKYKTILYLSMVYFCGEAILVTSSIFWDLGTLSIAQTLIGLFLIGVGTGGIKPCVLSFGGDQFFPHESKWRQNFFSIFYAAINLGSLISMFLTPLLRSKFQCVNRTDCFPYAFGVPCLLMFLSIVIFLLARNQYYKAPLPERNVVTAFVHCTYLAVSRKISGYKPKHDKSNENLPIKPSSSSSNTSSSNVSVESDEGINIPPERSYDSIPKQKSTFNKTNQIEDRSHWLYLSSDQYDRKSIEEFRSVLNIFLLIIPLPVYWCLSDQQGSIWTLQAVRMDGHIFQTGYNLLPDQMSVANPLLLLLLIPIYEVVIYPVTRKFNLLTTSIQRMTVGGLIASLAFVSSAMIEFRIQEFTPKQVLDPGHLNLLIVNGLSDCSVVDMKIIPSQPTNITLNSQPFHENNINILPLSTRSLSLMQDPWFHALNETFTTSYKLKFSLSSVETNQHHLHIQHNNTTLQPTTIGCPFSSSANYELTVQLPLKGSAKVLYIEQGNGKLDYKLLNDSLELPQAGQTRVRLLYEFFGSYSQAQKKQFSLIRQASGGTSVNFQPVERNGQLIISDYISLGSTGQGELFNLTINYPPANGLSSNNITFVQNEFYIKPGTRNLILVHQKDATNFESKLELLQDNNYRISMLFQLIPYLLISMSEVVFSITALEFSYAEAPETMRSVILAALLLTTALGNLLTVIIESMHLFSNPAHDLLFYAAFMAVDMVVFAILGSRFKSMQTKTK